MNNSEAISIAVELWRCFNEGRWDDARHLLADDFVAFWLQSDEKISGADNFIRLNQEYPGSHKIQVTNAFHYPDRSNFIDHVTTEVFIQSTYAEGRRQDLYAVSFFEIKGKKIISAREYFADKTLAPEWRKHLVERLV